MPDLERLLRYHALANREVAEAVSQTDSSPPRARSVLAHLIGTEWLWLQRLGVAAENIAVWPELPPEQWLAQLECLESVWRDALPPLIDRREERISYVNSKGEPWESRVDDVLTHVILHGAHHRGQIIAALRAAGVEPPYIDFIELTRRGRL